jgi:ankyrin repeat protein
LKKVFDIHAKGVYDITALCWASSRGHLKTVHCLVEKGADINAKDNYGRTALLRARGNEDVVQILRNIEGIEEAPALKRRSLLMRFLSFEPMFPT